MAEDQQGDDTGSVGGVRHRVEASVGRDEGQDNRGLIVLDETFLSERKVMSALCSYDEGG